MIVLDDPRHQRLRSIVSRAFTPKVVARIEASVRERARRLVASLIAKHPDGQADLVSELAGPLPLQVICDMMGIPEEDHQRIFHWTNVILGFGDPDLATDFAELAHHLFAQRVETAAKACDGFDHEVKTSAKLLQQRSNLSRLVLGHGFLSPIDCACRYGG